MLDPHGSVDAMRFGWLQDYACTLQLHRARLHLQSQSEGGANVSHSAIDTSMRSSRALEQRRRTRVPRPSATAEAWARIDRLLVDEAPAVPLYALRDADFVSRRVGNYVFNPQFGVLLDQMWVR